MVLILVVIFREQDLAGDVVQNLHEYFRVIYKKVLSFDIIMLFVLSVFSVEL